MSSTAATEPAGTAGHAAQDSPRGAAGAAPAGPSHGVLPLALVGLAVAAGSGCQARADPETGGLRVTGVFEPPGPGGFWAPVDVEVDVERVWVLDAGAAQAYAYDSAGRLLGTVGRPGSGPGELKDPLALGVAGDTLWVLNTGNARIEYFSRRGDGLGSERLPDSLPTPVDLVRWQGAFVGALPFGALPLVRFGGREPPALFGAELARRAAEIAPAGGKVPSVYRLGVVDGALWAAHLYLPLVAVYERPGRPARILGFTAPDVGVGETVYDEDEGARRWVQKAPPRPGGGLGFLEMGGETYLLTHRRDAGGRQVLIRWTDRADEGRSVAGPSGVHLVGSARAGSRVFAVGVRGDEEEPVVVVLGPARDEKPGTRTRTRAGR